MCKSLKTQPADIKRLRELEDEYRRLKRISADVLLENRALKDVSPKKDLKPAGLEARAGGGFTHRPWIK
jgi:hypothetical protein